MIKKTINVGKPYELYSEKNILADAGKYICEALGVEYNPEGNGVKLCIVTDENVEPLYGDEDQPLYESLLAAGFQVSKLVMLSGEAYKTLGTVTNITDSLAEEDFTRGDCLVALGGGVVGDVTGFAASIYMRGIPYVQIPTTLLAAVDSSVGGKTGVNRLQGKNLIGAFWQPSLVLFDPLVLESLKKKDLLNGMAEATKAALIDDSELLNKIADRAFAGTIFDDIDFLAEVASDSIDVKKAIVEEDELDKDKRQLLNFGHTLAHAIEKCSKYEISHGHAVAMGIQMVTRAAYKLGWCSEDYTGAFTQLLEKIGFDLENEFSAAELAKAVHMDKKLKNGRMTLVVPTEEGCVLKTIPEEEIDHFVEMCVE